MNLNFNASRRKEPEDSQSSEIFSELHFDSHTQCTEGVVGKGISPDRFKKILLTRVNKCVLVPSNRWGNMLTGFWCETMASAYESKGQGSTVGRSRNGQLGIKSPIVLPSEIINLSPSGEKRGRPHDRARWGEKRGVRYRCLNTRSGLIE